jgi:hypothetical protein
MKRERRLLLLLALLALPVLACNAQELLLEPTSPPSSRATPPPEAIATPTPLPEVVETAVPL